MKILDDQEQEAMDLIVATMNAILAMGLKANAGELVAAVHVMQSFVVQHALQRLDPEHFSGWYRDGTGRLVVPGQ